MTIEAALTRTLEIRFIDARAIANEAKLNLGISGYPSRDQQAMLVEEAIRIFEQWPDQLKEDMRRLRDHLDACKNVSESLLGGEASVSSSSSYEISEEFTGGSRRGSSMLDLFSRRKR